MRHTPEMARVESGILWRDVWNQIGLTQHHRRSHRKLVRELSKKQIMDAAKTGAHWLEEIALLEAMRRVAPLQTDLEDFTGRPSDESSGATAP
jgi:hypothetical protein